MSEAIPYASSAISTRSGSYPIKFHIIYLFIPISYYMHVQQTVGPILKDKGRLRTIHLRQAPRILLLAV